MELTEIGNRLILEFKATDIRTRISNIGRCISALDILNSPTGSPSNTLRSYLSEHIVDDDNVKTIANLQDVLYEHLSTQRATLPTFKYSITKMEYVANPSIIPLLTENELTKLLTIVEDLPTSYSVDCKSDVFINIHSAVNGMYTTPVERRMIVRDVITGELLARAHVVIIKLLTETTLMPTLTSSTVLYNSWWCIAMYDLELLLAKLLSN